MRHINGYIRSMLLTAALAAPAVILAAPAPQVGVQVRVYDPYHRDYHNWDDREDRAYRSYLAERHREYREYDRQSHHDQRNYWNWRHSHPDHE